MLFESKWILYNTGDYKSASDKYGNPAPYFRRKFIIEKAVKEVVGEAINVKCYSQKEIGDDKPEDIDDPFKALEELSKKHGIIEII